MDTAIEPTRPLTRGERRVRRAALLLAVALVLVALAARLLLSPRIRLPSIPNAAWIVQGQALTGGQPSDLDFLNLRDLSHVGAVIDLRGQAVEAAVLASYNMQYVSVPIGPGQAPTVSQLAAMVGFIRASIQPGGAFLVHDEFGLDPAPTVGIMLAILHGESPSAALGQARAAQPGLALSPAQATAIESLAAARSQPPLALPGVSPSPNPAAYLAAAQLSW